MQADATDGFGSVAINSWSVELEQPMRSWEAGGKEKKYDSERVTKRYDDNGHTTMISG